MLKHYTDAEVASWVYSVEAFWLDSGKLPDHRRISIPTKTTINYSRNCVGLCLISACPCIVLFYSHGNKICAL